MEPILVVQDGATITIPPHRDSSSPPIKRHASSSLTDSASSSGHVTSKFPRASNDVMPSLSKPVATTKSQFSIAATQNTNRPTKTITGSNMTGFLTSVASTPSLPGPKMVIQLRGPAHSKVVKSIPARPPYNIAATQLLPTCTALTNMSIIVSNIASSSSIDSIPSTAQPTMATTLRSPLRPPERVSHMPAKPLHNVAAKHTTKNPIALDMASPQPSIDVILNSPQPSMATTLRSPLQPPRVESPEPAPVLAHVQKEQACINVLPTHPMPIISHSPQQTSQPQPASPSSPVKPSQEPSPPCLPQTSPSYPRAQTTKLQILKGASGKLVAELATMASSVASPLLALARHHDLNIKMSSAKPPPVVASPNINPTGDSRVESGITQPYWTLLLRAGLQQHKGKGQRSRDKTILLHFSPE